MQSNRHFKYAGGIPYYRAEKRRGGYLLIAKMVVVALLISTSVLYSTWKLEEFMAERNEKMSQEKSLEVPLIPEPIHITATE